MVYSIPVDEDCAVSLLGFPVIIVIAINSIALYLTDKDERTALYKINNNVCSKTSKIINYVVIILYSAHTRAHTCTHAQKECDMG